MVCRDSSGGPSSHRPRATEHVSGQERLGLCAAQTAGRMGVRGQPATDRDQAGEYRADGPRMDRRRPGTQGRRRRGRFLASSGRGRGDQGGVGGPDLPSRDPEAATGAGLCGELRRGGPAPSPCQRDQSGSSQRGGQGRHGQHHCRFIRGIERVVPSGRRRSGGDNQGRNRSRAGHAARERHYHL